MTRLERLVGIAGLLFGAFDVYAYLFPDSSRLSPLAFYAWMIFALILVVGALLLASGKVWRE